MGVFIVNWRHEAMSPAPRRIRLTWIVSNVSRIVGWYKSWLIVIRMIGIVTWVPRVVRGYESRLIVIGMIGVVPWIVGRDESRLIVIWMLIRRIISGLIVWRIVIRRMVTHSFFFEL